MTTAPSRPMATASRRDPHLTPRQREVLDLLAKGRSNPEIANALGVSLDGAKWHVREIMAELDVPTREDAAEWWRRYNGLPMRLRRFAGGIVGAAAARWVVVSTVGVAVLATTTLVVLALANRGDDPSADEPMAAESATARPSQSSSATSPPTPSTPTPEPTSAPPSGPVTGAHPPGTTTGNSLIDAVIAAVEAGDRSSFQALFSSTKVPCDRETFTVLPECASGEADGALVDTVYTFQCEAGWVGLRDLKDWREFEGDHLGVRSVVAGAYPVGRETPPRRTAETWVVFANDAVNRPQGYAVALTSDGVVAFGRSCGGTLEEFGLRYEAVASRFIIPPPE